jgi:predicted nucleic acid-binding protein
VKIFVDTNILVAALAEKGDKADKAEKVLESDNEVYTSLLNIMELRTVLTKKKRVEQEEAESTVEEVVENLEVVIPDSSDFIESNKLQIESLLYPQDCLILQIADAQDCALVSYDSELTEHGAVRPEDIL